MKVQKQSRLLLYLPQGTRLWGDRGYTSLDKFCPQHEVIVPRIRPKGGRLSQDDRGLNYQMSKVRITVENIVCKMKSSVSVGSFTAMTSGTIYSSGAVWLA